MTTLVERLRSGQEIHDGDWSMLDDAIERIEELERQLAEANAALNADWGDGVMQENLNAKKQIALLREALDRLVVERTAGLASLSSWNNAKAALAATEEKK